MDLWRKSSLGHLAQVLGPNFIDRDVMTARVQYRGDTRVEWASYAPGTEQIAEAFVAGINAWVFRARARLPDEFVLAGWIPDLWTKDDLLNRTDAFLSSGDAELESFRAQVIADVGRQRADALFPSLARREPWPVSDLAAAGRAVGDALRRAGAAPYFAGFAAPFAGSNVWAVPTSRSKSGAPVLAADPHRALTSPSPRYLIHLKAPGWNVIGATSPWLPGVVMGHNERVAWGMASHHLNTQTITVEQFGDADVPRVEVVKDQLFVKSEGPFAFERQYTKHGVVIATDRGHHLVFTLGWSGFEPGAASELGAVALDRADSIADLQAAIANWKMPTVDVVYADRSTVGQQTSGTTAPQRGASSSSIPIAANENVPRTNRIRMLVSARSTFTIDDVKAQQHDVLAWNAEQLVPRLRGLRAPDAEVERARRRLVDWDRRVAADSATAALYVLWERATWRLLTERRLPSSLVEGYLRRVPFDVAVALRAKDDELLDALATAARQASENPESGRSRPLFRHPLAITQAARRRFDVGPFTVDGYESTVMAFSTGADVDVGPSFRQIVSVADWDDSVATNAPGQSEWTSSSHFADLSRIWAAGAYFPLAFSDRAVRANAESTLILQPIR